MKLRTLFAAALLAGIGNAHAHHGWSEYQADKPLDLTGTIEASGYEQPHGFVRLKSGDKTWLVVLAPPYRMQSRGLPREKLVAGQKVTVHAYPHRSKDGEARAERITVEGKTTELR